MTPTRQLQVLQVYVYSKRAETATGTVSVLVTDTGHRYHLSMYDHQQQL